MNDTIISYFKKYSVLAAICILIASCNSRVGLFSDFLQEERFMEQLQTYMPELDLPDQLLQQKLLRDASVNMWYAYQLNSCRPIWFDNKGPKDEVFYLVRSLNELWDEGINPGTYKVGYLQQVLSQLENRPWGSRFSLDSIIAWDTIFTKTYLQAALDLQMGKVPMQEADAQWFLPNDEAFSGATYLIGHLRHQVTFPSFDTFRPKIRMYYLMKDAVAFWRNKKKDAAFLKGYNTFRDTADPAAGVELIRQCLMRSGSGFKDSAANAVDLYSWFQYSHQLPVSGQPDSATKTMLLLPPDYYLGHLLLNMERLRCLPRHLEHEYIWINIPQMDLSYIIEQQQILYSRVAIGRRNRQTPGFKELMTSIIFNPSRKVPTAIVLQDIGPGISRSGVAYLHDKGLKAVNAAGTVVTDLVTFENFKQFTYNQAPGPDNALGGVQFFLPGKHDRSLHDTPYKNSFGGNDRAISSGAIRVQRPYDLAQLVLVDQGFRRSTMDAIIRSRRTHALTINRELPVYMVYLTIGMDSVAHDIRYLQDVYDRDSTAMNVLGY